MVVVVVVVAMLLRSGVCRGGFLVLSLRGQGGSAFSVACPGESRTENV